MRRIHKMCTYLRRLQAAGEDGVQTLPTKCEECKAWKRDKVHGRCQPMCYGLAEEAINIALTGNPWGKERSTWPRKQSVKVHSEGK